MTLLDKQRNSFHLGCGVITCGKLVVFTHKPPQFAGLSIIVIVILTLIVIEHLPSIDIGGSLSRRIVSPFAIAVGLIRHSVAIIVIGTHLSVAMERMEWAFRAIHGNKVMVYAKTVTLCISIREESPMKHLIRRKTDAVNYIGRVEAQPVQSRQKSFQDCG